LLLASINYILTCNVVNLQDHCTSYCCCR